MISRNLVDQIERWESGDMEEDEEASFFQSIIDSGLVWTLQGMHRRQAMRLIASGVCHPAHDQHRGKPLAGASDALVHGGSVPARSE